MLNPLGQRAIDKLDLSNGKRILDIGCGCGATTLEIAKMIPEGKIIGVDISEPMLEPEQAKMHWRCLYRILNSLFRMYRRTKCPKIF